jgi:hypothetical protein
MVYPGEHPVDPSGPPVPIEKHNLTRGNSRADFTINYIEMSGNMQKLEGGGQDVSHPVTLWFVVQTVN